MSIKHLLSYIVRCTSSEALQKLLEMTPSNLKTERCTLQDILANVFDCLLAISFSEGLATLYERLNEICFFSYKTEFVLQARSWLPKCWDLDCELARNFPSFCWWLGLGTFHLEILTLNGRTKYLRLLFTACFCSFWSCFHLFFLMDGTSLIAMIKISCELDQLVKFRRPSTDLEGKYKFSVTLEGEGILANCIGWSISSQVQKTFFRLQMVDIQCKVLYIDKNSLFMNKMAYPYDFSHFKYF